MVYKLPQFIAWIVFLAAVLAAGVAVWNSGWQLENIPWGATDPGPMIVKNDAAIPESGESGDNRTPATSTEELSPQAAPDLEKTAKLEPSPAVVAATVPEKIIKTAGASSTANGALSVTGVIAKTNLERQKFLGAGYDLEENALLDKAAQVKAADMLKNQYFDHVSPAGHNVSFFVANAGYSYVAVGENLAMGDFASDAELVKAWMDSPGHRANILKSGYKEIGAAVAFGKFDGRNVWLAVQEFGTPKTACPVVDKDLLQMVNGIEGELQQLSAGQNTLLEKINSEKETISDLEWKIQSLKDSHASYLAIKAKQDEYNGVIDQVNRDVGAYNVAIKDAQKIYGEYKINIEKYNSQVTAFNACLADIK